jgi:hypothetical protein
VQQRPLDGPVVLLDDVVEVLVLTHQDIDASVSLDTFNGGRVGAALVNGDLLWHIVQIDGALQEPASRSQIALGSEKKVHRVAITVDGAVEVFPLARNFDVSLITARFYAAACQNVLGKVPSN